MSKFNTVNKRGTRATGPIQTNPVATGTTYNGAPGYEYDTLSALFLLACSNMVGEDTFYESADKRDGRYVQLIHQAVNEGHAAWLARFLPWLRNSANMRTAAVIGAVETARAMVVNKIPGSRQIVASSLQRADEPGEALAYYFSAYHRNVPKPIKRGIADAVARLYSERNTLKYDTESKGLRFGDVLELVHASPQFLSQGTLFKYLIDRGKGRTPLTIPSSLTMIHANQALRERAAKDPKLLLNTAQLRAAGMTWEAAKSLAGKQVSDKDFWEIMIPEMGYMALLRNLRAFDEAGISGLISDVVKEKLKDPEQVAKSRQLPMRFLAAYRNVPSNRWAHALDVALELCLGSVPEFKGSTLILIDTSGSMTGNMSGKSQLKLRDASALFGLALARRCENPTVVSYASTFMPFPQVKGESLLRSMDRFQKGYFIGSGTATAQAVQTYYRGHDRVIVLTDEQADMNYGVFRPVPQDKVAVTFNLAGYRYGHAPVGTRTRLAVGGLSDAAFTLLHSMEARSRGQWPF